MLTKEVKKALAVERQEMEARKQDLATQIVALDVKIKSIDGVMGTPDGPGIVGEPGHMQKPIVALLRSHPYGMTPQDITRELLKQGHLDTPSRKLITSVWQVLYRLKRDNKIKVKTGGIHIWIGGDPFARPMKPGGVREGIRNLLMEAPDGFPKGEIVSQLEGRGVTAVGTTPLKALIGTVLGQMQKRTDIKLKNGRWIWAGGVVSPAGGWNKMSADERSTEMKRRMARKRGDAPVENGSNGNGHQPGTAGMREKMTQVITAQPGITRVALRNEMEALFTQSGKTSVSDLVWIELAQQKRNGKVIERVGKLYPPVATVPAVGQLVWGIRAIMKTHPAGITRAVLREKLQAQGYTVQGKQTFAKRVINEVSRMKVKKEVREKDELLFLTGKVPVGIHGQKVVTVAPPVAEEPAKP